MKRVDIVARDPRNFGFTSETKDNFAALWSRNLAARSHQLARIGSENIGLTTGRRADMWSIASSLSYQASTMRVCTVVELITASGLPEDRHELSHP